MEKRARFCHMRAHVERGSAPLHPVFYLKQWARDNGRLCEFSKPYDCVKPRKTRPVGTGYADGLNTIEGLPPTESRFLEDVFFQVADDTAARALKILLSPPPWTFSSEERSGWSRFIMALMVRNPEAMQKYMRVAIAIFKETLGHIEAYYEKRRGPNDSPTYAEYAERHGPNPAARTIVRVVQSLADNAELGRRINSMRWAVFSAANPKFELLTSDRPMLITNGIGPPAGHLIMPISPVHIFVATNNIEKENEIRAVWKGGKAIEQVNERVACQSRKYVYGTDDEQLAFVSKRLGLAYTADPLESLSFDTLLAAARSGVAESRDQD
jgi:hypothetical protein